MNTPSIAFSFSNTKEESWIPTGIYRDLTKYGFNVYFSSEKPDDANGILWKELREIYNKSLLNVVFLSKTYAEKPKNSIVSMERDLLIKRHINNNAPNSLFIITIDDVTVPKEFRECLFHSIKDIGHHGAVKIIKKRITEQYAATEPALSRLEHPTNVVGNRGQMMPCTFRLSCNFKQDGPRRWDILSDVLVVPLNIEIPVGLRTYLIPSASAPPFLSHSTVLKNDKGLLSIKKKISNDFYKKHKKDDLTGVLFFIESDGMSYPHIYCNEYDSYLHNNWAKHTNL